jgi:CBS-domain-containing membrane protein
VLDRVRLAVLCALLIGIGAWIDRRLLLPLAAVVGAGLAIALAVQLVRRRRRSSAAAALAFIATPIATVGPGASHRAMRQALRAFPAQPVLPVFDAERTLCGIVVCSELARDLLDQRSARELMREPIAIDVATRPRESAALMRRNNLPALPVLNRGVLVGLMCRSTEVPAVSADPVFLGIPLR